MMGVLYRRSVVFFFGEWGVLPTMVGVLCWCWGSSAVDGGDIVMVMGYYADDGGGIVMEIGVLCRRGGKSGGGGGGVFAWVEVGGRWLSKN